MNYDEERMLLARVAKLEADVSKENARKIVHVFVRLFILIALSWFTSTVPTGSTEQLVSLTVMYSVLAIMSVHAVGSVVYMLIR